MPDNTFTYAFAQGIARKYGLNEDQLLNLFATYIDLSEDTFNDFQEWLKEEAPQVQRTVGDYVDLADDEGNEPVSLPEDLYFLEEAPLVFLSVSDVENGAPIPEEQTQEDPWGE